MNLRRTFTALLCGLSLSGSLPASSASPAAFDFSRPDLEGKPIALADFRGKVVLLNFWASWCGPCLLEMPRFSSWQRAYGTRGLQVIGISMDDDAAPVSRLLARRPTGYPVVMGDAQLAKSFGGVYGLPATFLIDTQGRIAGKFLGESNLGEMEARIQALLPRP